MRAEAQSTFAGAMGADGGAPVRCPWVRLGSCVGGNGEGARVSAIVRAGKPFVGGGWPARAR